MAAASRVRRLCLRPHCPQRPRLRGSRRAPRGVRGPEGLQGPRRHRAGAASGGRLARAVHALSHGGRPPGLRAGGWPDAAVQARATRHTGRRGFGVSCLARDGGGRCQESGRGGQAHGWRDWARLGSETPASDRRQSRPWPASICVGLGARHAAVMPTETHGPRQQRPGWVSGRWRAGPGGGAGMVLASAAGPWAAAGWVGAGRD